MLKKLGKSGHSGETLSKDKRKKTKEIRVPEEEKCRHRGEHGAIDGKVNRETVSCVRAEPREKGRDSRDAGFKASGKRKTAQRGLQRK